MTVLYVASDEEGAGKTAFCAALALRLHQAGKKVVALKPVARAGITSQDDPDPNVYRVLLPELGLPTAVNPLDAPVEAAGGVLDASALAHIKATVDHALEEVDVVVVEGSCGLSEEASGQVTEALDSNVVVIGRYSRELTDSGLSRWRDLCDGRLVGFVINGLTRYLESDFRGRLLPLMGSEGLVNLGVVREDRRMLGVTVRQLADHLGGRFVVSEGSTDALVEHLMIGGMGLDPGNLYFGLREDKAVIVRGDRPDIQMAALGTPTACMVLTEGKEPIEYVSYEAAQEQVPVIVVPTNTLDTMDALATLMERALVDHPLKVGRFAELLGEHVDLQSIYSRLGIQV